MNLKSFRKDCILFTKIDAELSGRLRKKVGYGTDKNKKQTFYRNCAVVCLSHRYAGKVVDPIALKGCDIWLWNLFQRLIYKRDFVIRTHKS